MSGKSFTLKEIDIVYKPLQEMPSRPKINCPADAIMLFRENWDYMKIGLLEQFKVMFLNRSNRVLGIANLSTGGVSGTVVDPKLIFGMALKSMASSIILAHNHPSGNVEPSDVDVKLTQKLEEAGKLLDIAVLDHIILSGLDNKVHAMNEKLSL